MVVAFVWDSGRGRVGDGHRHTDTDGEEMQQKSGRAAVVKGFVWVGIQG